MFDWVLSTPCCSESTIKTLEQRPWKPWIRINVRFLGVPGKQKDKGKKSSKNGKDQKL